MAGDEKSSTLLATQTRDGSLKRFGKALANLYRDNQNIELTGGKDATSRREWVRSGEFRIPKFRRVTRFDSTDGSGVKLEIQTKSRDIPTAKAVQDLQEIDQSRRIQARLNREELSKKVDSSIAISERRINEGILSSASKLVKTTDLEKTRFVLSKKGDLGQDVSGNSIISRRTSGALSYGRDEITIKLATGNLDNHAAAAAAISESAGRTTWRDAAASGISKLSERNRSSKLDERSRDRGVRGL